MTRYPDLNRLVLPGVGGADGHLRIFQVAQHDIVTGGKRNGGQGGIQPHGGIVGKGDFRGLSLEQPGGFLSGLNSGLAERPIIGRVAHLSRSLSEQGRRTLDGLGCRPRRQPDPGSVQIDLLRCSGKIRAYGVHIKHRSSRILMIHHGLFTGRENGAQQAVNGDPQLSLVLFESGVYGCDCPALSGPLPESVELDFQALGQ